MLTDVGALINGYVAGKVGYRWVMIYALAIMNAFIFVIFFASNAGVLVAGQVLVGLTWGESICIRHALW